MCDPYDTLPSASRPTVRPSSEERLAELLNRDLGTSVKPREMRLFVVANWKLVCSYAHAIHDASSEGSAA